MDTLLELENLGTTFRTHDGPLQAVEGLSLTLAAGETLALVGESGCGKSVTARSVMGLYSGSRVSQSGSIRFKGEELSGASPERRAELRGGAMAMIFQEPMSSFDPLATVREQMTDARLAHAARPGGPLAGLSDKEARRRAEAEAVEALRAVGIPDPEIRLGDYPHRLSGGMLQRVLIAIALMNDPELLIADEPTTALDVTIQAQVLRLIRDLRERRGTGVLFITHDLGVVAEIADRVHVMYAGRIVEKASVAEFFGSGAEARADRHADRHADRRGPLHPYGRGLLASRITREAKAGELPSIPGTVPRPFERPAGCRFAPRCPEAGPRCLREEPPLMRADGPGGTSARGAAREGAREAACWLLTGGVA